MSHSRAYRYSLFALVYLAQGAILSYFTALNAIYLLSFDLTMGQIGLFSAIAMLPFVLKIFLGMLSDRVSLLGRGHRQPYILLGLLVQAVGLLIIPAIHPGTQFALFALVAFVVMAGMALYDTCTDGLALDTTTIDEQGAVQGIMVGGRAVGIVAISVLIGVLAQLSSWRAAFWGLALVTLVPVPLVLGVRERPRSAGMSFQWRAFRALGRREVLAVGLFGALNSLVTYGTNQLVNPFLESAFGAGRLFAGLYTAVWGIGVVLGALGGGRLADRIGHRGAALVSVVAAAVAVLALAATSSAAMAWPIVAVFGVAFGICETVFFAISMERCEPQIAASMYAILMAVANIGTGIGLALGGSLVDVVGYRWTFVALAAANGLVLATIPLMFGRRAAVRREDVRAPASPA